MKSLFKRMLKNGYLFFLLFFVTLVFIVIPIIINLIYKTSAPFTIFESEWSSGEFLLYIGGFSASLTTIIAVYITLNADYLKELENKRFSILPYFIITKLDIKSYANIFDFSNEIKSDSKDNSLELYKLNKIYAVIDNGLISYSSSLEKEKQKLMETGGYHWVKKENTLNLTKEGLLILPLVFENIGNGTAIMTVLSFYKTEENRRYVHLQSLKQNESLELSIYLENAKDKDIGEYYVEIGYQDIYGNSYTQKYQIDVVKDDNVFGMVVNLQQPSVDSTQVHVSERGG